jgi:hypothetical protein
MDARPANAPLLPATAQGPAPTSRGLHIEHLVLQGSRDATLAPRFAQALQSALGAAGWPQAQIGRLTLDVSGLGGAGGHSLEGLAQQVAQQIAAQRGTRRAGGPE